MSIGTSSDAGARERVLERLVDVEVQHVAELVRLGSRRRPRCRWRGSGVSWLPKLDLPSEPSRCRERLVAEEVDPLVGEVELHVLRGRLRERALARRPAGGVAGMLRRRLEVEVALARRAAARARRAAAASFACASSSPSPRSASSISGVNCPLSISALRIACFSASSERSCLSPKSPQQGCVRPPAKPDCSRKSASLSSSACRSTASASSGLNFV